MNREILFRGKRIDNGEWAYSQTVFSHLDNFYIPTQNLKCTVMRNLDTVGNISEIRCKDGKCFFKVHPETVGQFTGLTDKNSRKIFEGDILSIAQVSNGIGDYFYPPLKYPSNAIVKWDKCSWMWEIIAELRYYLTFPDAWCHFECKVIGNIHDNPELLEVTE